VCPPTDTPPVATLTDGNAEKAPDSVVSVAYANFVREPLRTFARDEVQRRPGLVVKDQLIPIGDAVLARIRQYADASPFVISSVVVGNVQYPEEVADAVSRKLAATQELERKDTELRSSGRRGPSARCRPPASPTRCRSSAAS
jgi:regulator of protease activity HflC (stomatin/prohibitin superfamily)